MLQAMLSDRLTVPEITAASEDMAAKCRNADTRRIPGADLSDVSFPARCPAQRSLNTSKIRLHISPTYTTWLYKTRISSLAPSAL
jgi:hypothetical protein